MATSAVIGPGNWQTRLLSMPNGARFHRCALQVNPYQYTVRHPKGTGVANETEYNNQVVAALLKGEVEVIAVTDHFAIRHSEALIKTAEATGITVFPGFEAETKDGVHILCLFEPGTTADAVQARIHDCGIHSEEEAAQRAKYDCEEFFSEAKKWGALCIAPHVTSDKGLLAAMEGGRCAIAVWTHPLLLACAIPGKLDETPPEFAPILKNTNAQYRRNRPIAILNAQDVSSPDDVFKAGAVTEIKMSELSVEGLRQAFIDPDARVRRFDQMRETPRLELLGLRWQGGFLDGIELRLNANLNVLIGGRGTGKSTIVESIRYAVGMSPTGEEAMRAHETLVRYVLKEASTVSLLVRTHSPAVHDYWIERIVPNPPQVRELDGSVSALRPLDVVSGLEIFGQHEIAEMVRNRAQLTSLLHRFAPDESALAARKAELRLKLQRSRGSLIELSTELQQIEERLSALPALKETLARYKSSGLEEKLRDQALLIREERILKTTRERIAAIDPILTDLRSVGRIDTGFASDKTLEELPAADSLRPVRNLLDDLSRALVKAADQISAASETARDKVAEIEKGWTSSKAARQAAYEATLRDLQKSAGTVDAAAFGKLHTQISNLEPSTERRDAIRRELEGLRKERTQLLAEWEHTKAEHFQLLTAAAKKLSREVEWRVRVTVELGGDRSTLLTLLQQDVGGTLKPVYDRLVATENFSLPALVTACRAGAEKLREDFGLTPAQADRLCRAGESVFLKIEELDFPLTTKLELNLSEPGQSPEWRALEQLSKGQKATAVLLLLLLESEAPLIVDQPEDDLDNRFISDGIVPKIRVGKQRRQFIFATHNANIPVLGDAELIAALEASGEPGAGVPAQARLAAGGVGSIDNAAVRQLVGEILEGGEAAFEMRRMKYGY